jgi:hypothetical protein
MELATENPGVGDPIEVGSPAVVEADQFSIHDRAVGQTGQGLRDVRKLSVQRLLSAREERHTAAGVNREVAMPAPMWIHCPKCGLNHDYMLSHVHQVERDEPPPSDYRDKI